MYEYKQYKYCLKLSLWSDPAFLIKYILSLKTICTSHIPNNNNKIIQLLVTIGPVTTD